MLAIKDLQGEVYLLTGASNIVRKRRVNGEKELSLKLDKTKQNAHFFDDIDKLWRVIDFNGEEYPVLIYRDAAVGNGYTREISCLHSFYDDMRNHVIYETFTGSRTFVDMMNFIFNGSGYTFNIIDQFYAQDFENFGDDYGLELFKTALERYQSEFSVQGKIVTLRAKIGNTTDFQYRHKFNLESIEREVDALDFSTYGEGLGKDGLHVTYTSPLAEIYGIRPIKAIRDERYTQEESMSKRLKDTIDNSLKITLTVKLSDLRASGYNKNHPDEGDVIILVDDRFKLKIDTRIVEITELFDKNGTVLDCDVTLSNFSNIFEQQRRIHNATKTIADAIEGKRPLPFQSLAIAVQQATIALQNAQTELEFPENGGILAIDKTNPNKLVLFNSAGIGISDDGGQTFETALTGAGLVANTITSGTINTAFVRIEGASGNIFITGDQFKSVDVNDANKYVEITPGELYIAKGAMTIERPDGYKVIDNGMASFDFAVEAHEPPFTHDLIEVSGPWWTSAQNDRLNLQFYTLKKTGRYLNIWVVHGLETEGNTGGVYVYSSGEPQQLLGYKYFSNKVTDLENNESIITIDLGVPDGSLFSFYLRGNTGNITNKAYIRKKRIWVSD